MKQTEPSTHKGNRLDIQAVTSKVTKKARTPRGEYPHIITRRSATGSAAWLSR